MLPALAPKRKRDRKARRVSEDTTLSAKRERGHDTKREATNWATPTARNALQTQSSMSLALISFVAGVLDSASHGDQNGTSPILFLCPAALLYH